MQNEKRGQNFPRKEDSFQVDGSSSRPQIGFSVLTVDRWSKQIIEHERALKAQKGE